MRRALASLYRVDLQRSARLVAPMAGAAPPPPAGFARVGALADVPEGLSEAELRPGARVMLVRRAGGALHALGGECPHRQAQMAVGDIEEAASTCSVICPRHRKRFEGGLHFDVDSGRSFLLAGAAPCDEYDPSWRLPVYDVLVRDGAVFVSAAPRPDSGAPAAAAAGAGAVPDAVVGAGAVPDAVVGAGAGAGSSVSEMRSEWQLEAVAQLRKDVRLLTLRRRHSGSDRAAAAADGAAAGPWHVRLALSPERGSTARDYTPISSLADFGEGRLTLLVKVYEHGALTRPLSKLAPGASLYLSPPLRTTESYEMQARVEADARADGGGGGGGGGGGSGAALRDVLLLVCGGSGVTPVLQMARWALDGCPDSAPPPAFFASVLVLTSMRSEAICREERRPNAGLARSPVTGGAEAVQSARRSHHQHHCGRSGAA